jgi:NitT/TauT family transport system substrate-binding protein
MAENTTKKDARARREFLRQAGIAAAALALPGVARSQGRKQLKLGAIPSLNRAPFMIAQARGYYADEGLEVELLQFSSGGDIVAPLAAGQIDGGISISPSAGLINAIASGLDVKIAASNGTAILNRNTGVLIVRKDLAPASGFLDLSTLKTPVRAAATGPGLLPEAVVLLALEKAGIKPSDVRMTYLGLPDMNIAMKNGAIDIAGGGDPLVAIGVNQGILARHRQMAELHPNIPFANFMLGPNLLKKDRKAGLGLMRAYLRAVRDYEDAFAKGKDRDAIVAILSKPLNISPQLFNDLQAQGGLTYFNPDGTVTVEPLRPILEFWVRTKAVQPGFRLENLVDHSLANEAVAQLGKYQP